MEKAHGTDKEQPPARTPDTDAQPSDSRATDRSPRRSCRVTIAIPIVVYGKGSDGKIFHESASTFVVNAHGALLSLNTAVARQQRLVLVNPKLQREVECSIVYAKPSGVPGQFEVGVEFDKPAPGFWGIAFPPPDWSNADRKRPSRSKPRH